MCDDRRFVWYWQRTYDPAIVVIPVILPPPPPPHCNCRRRNYPHDNDHDDAVDSRHIPIADNDDYDYDVDQDCYRSSSSPHRPPRISVVIIVGNMLAHHPPCRASGWSGPWNDRRCRGRSLSTSLSLSFSLSLSAFDGRQYHYIKSIALRKLPPFSFLSIPTNRISDSLGTTRREQVRPCRSRSDDYDVVVNIGRNDNKYV